MLNWLPALLILIAHGGAGQFDSASPHAMLRLITVTSRFGESPSSVVPAVISIKRSAARSINTPQRVLRTEGQIGRECEGFISGARVRDGPRVLNQDELFVVYAG